MVPDKKATVAPDSTARRPYHDFSAFGRNVVDHAHGIRKQVGIPGEIPFPVRVFNVQPDHVVGEIVFFKLRVDRPDIRFVPVVPTALVVPQGKQRGLSTRKKSSGVSTRGGKVTLCAL